MSKHFQPTVRQRREHPTAIGGGLDKPMPHSCKSHHCAVCRAPHATVRGTRNWRRRQRNKLEGAQITRLVPRGGAAPGWFLAPPVAGGVVFPNAEPNPLLDGR